MAPYVLFADSSCDLPENLMHEWEIHYSSLSFIFDDSDRIYRNYDMPAKEFYSRIRAGHSAKTSAVNSADFEEAFSVELEKGNDILYLGFSTGLSATYQDACVAADELKKKYPERKILTVDTLSASGGYGMIVYLTRKQKLAGATIEEAAQYAENLKLHQCHWFTVDDLSYLIKGGRVVTALASVGSKLNIKPVMHMDNAGHLIPVTVARGRKNSLKALAARYGKLAQEKGAGPVYISHGDCMVDVEFLAKVLKDDYNVDVERIVDVGPVIGSHTGPGVVALFFIGRER